MWVNDVHSQLNRTEVLRTVHPKGVEDLQGIVKSATREGRSLAISGGRHAMGTQQFATGSVLVDTRGMDAVLTFDQERGQVTVEPGIQWPALIAWLNARHRPGEPGWGIRQKQTGADRLTIGGSLSVNAHGRGLAFQPFVGDVSSFRIVTADARILTCSRQENTELFSLVIGGYGLFGLVSEVTLQLSRRQRLRRDVEILDVRELRERFESRIREGYLYGDYQFSCDEASDDFLRRGVFSCYVPVEDPSPDKEAERHLGPEDWQNLIHLAHTDKSRAFQLYAKFYESTSGQHYWSDTHQLSFYQDDYHATVDQATGARVPASEIITELYVPRERLEDFLSAVRDDFRRHGVNLFYGTIRLIEADRESFLPWAKERFACVIFNLHTEHSTAGIEHSAAAFRRLIDLAVERRGSYFLTYHRFARRDQVETCYPNFREFLARKRHYDPREIFQSDWYRHYRRLFHE